MPCRGRGRKRKASESVGDVEACINQPDPGNLGQNVLDFEKFIRASNILPVVSLSDDCIAIMVGASAADSIIASG